MKFAVILALLMVGCRGAREIRAARLDGTYGVAHAGTVEPVLKVQAVPAGGYEFEERTAGEWKHDADVPHVTTAAEVTQVLGTVPTGFYVYGLATGSVGVLKVPAGWSGAGVTTKSGFLLVSHGTVAAAEKIELGAR
jgi:hypothetical protein